MLLGDGIGDAIGDVTKGLMLLLMLASKFKFVHGHPVMETSGTSCHELPGDSPFLEQPEAP